MSKTRKKEQKVTEVNSSHYLKSTETIMLIGYLTPRHTARHCSSYHRLTLPRTCEKAGKEGTR